METAKLEGALQVLSTSLSRTKWRLKASSKRRLEVDILALCTGMRPVVMVDYGGKMPELQERLCAVLKLSQQASSIFYHLRIMVIEDMIYLIHVKELAEHVRSSLNKEPELLFVDLEHDPLKMIVQAEKSSVAMQLISVQKWFSLLFPIDEINNDLLPSITTEVTSIANSSINGPIASQSSEVIDLSSCIQGTQVTVPTLNGWLLGYPVVYLFSTEHISDAIFNLSTKSLRIFKILICRNDAYKGSGKEELLSFSVPYDLSMAESNEPWAKAFMAHLEAKWEKCKQVWTSLQMEEKQIEVGFEGCLMVSKWHALSRHILGHEGNHRSWQLEGQQGTSCSRIWSQVRSHNPSLQFWLLKLGLINAWVYSSDQKHLFCGLLCS